MFQKWLKHIVEGSTHFGIEVNEVDGKERFSLLKLVHRNKELENILEMTTDSLDTIILHLDKNVPVFLTLNTANVLKKMVDQVHNPKSAKLVLDAFPNLQLEDFYYQILTGDTKQLVSLAKKEYVQSYVEKVQTMGIPVFSIALGTSTIHTISGFLDKPILGPNYILEFQKGTLVDFALTVPEKTGKYVLNGLTVSSDHLLSFSHILGHVIAAVTSSNLQKINKAHSDAFKNKRLFDFGLKTSICFFLVLLLSNFLFFTHFSKKNTEIKSALASNEQQGHSIQQLKARILEKEERLQVLDHSKNARVSLYLDEIGQKLPHSILLSRIEYQPLVTPVTANKSINTKKEIISISGVSEDKQEFTTWTDHFERQEWIERVEIVTYEYLSNASVTFTINIALIEI